MIGFLPSWLKGALSASIFALNTLFWSLLIYALIPFRLLVPVPPVRRWCNRQMTRIGENWISINSWGLDLIHRIRWDVQGIESVRCDRSYLVCANHRSWVDIVVLQKIFNRRVPFLRFFLKRELIWVPLLGGAWWALDFPFMKRYSREFLERHPEKRGQDLETTRRACERFRGSPITVLNFLEGTRFTVAKHANQRSPYSNLLAPKAGGVAFVIEAMGEQFEALLDVTIHYPAGAISLWGLFTGRMKDVVVRVREIAIPREILGGDYLEDAAFRERFQAWVREIWERKDRLIDSFSLEAGTAGSNSYSSRKIK